MDLIGVIKHGWGTALMSVIFTICFIYPISGILAKISPTFYVLLHIFTVVLLKLYCSDMEKAHKNLEFKRQHAPFVRKDLHLIDLTRSLWWLLIWPRFLFYFSWCTFWTIIFTIVTAGKEISNIKPW